MKSTKSLSSLTIMAFLVVVTVGTAGGRIIYVDDNAPGKNNGSSWVDAYKYLQDALTAAQKGDEIRVAQGVYKADRDRFEPNGTGERESTFRLKSGVVLYGGFPAGGADMNERDPNTHRTILSGDLNGDDVKKPKAQDLPGEPNRGENSFHVVNGSGCDSTAVLDGFQITGGQANGAGNMQDIGGGLYIEQGSPTIVGCNFVANVAATSGGAMYINNNSNPGIINCGLERNWAGSGGAAYSGANSYPVLDDCNFAGNGADSGAAIKSSTGGMHLTACTFSDNSANNVGGAMSSGGKMALLVGCRFIHNSAVGDGGAIWDGSSDLTMVNCLFVENDSSSGDSGGGVCALSVKMTLANCVFSENSCRGFYGGGGVFTNSDDITLTNCIFSGNLSRSEYSNGGGMNIWPSAGKARITNCTFSGNRASSGGGIVSGISDRQATIRNCIFWGNRDSSGIGESAQIGGQADVKFSCVQGGWSKCKDADCNNINADPLFVDPDGADNVLGTADDDLRLSCGSPCIDTGSNSEIPRDTLDLDDDGDVNEPTPVDADGKPRVILGMPCGSDGLTAKIDMGAYEYVGIPKTSSDYAEWLKVGCPC